MGRKKKGLAGAECNIFQQTLYIKKKKKWHATYFARKHKTITTTKIENIGAAFISADYRYKTRSVFFENYILLFPLETFHFKVLIMWLSQMRPNVKKSWKKERKKKDLLKK